MKNALLLFLFFPFLGFSQLSGNYVINSSNPNSNFKTLAAAVNYINSVGVKGPVTFLLDEDQTVSATIVINLFPGSSAVNTLTIKPSADKNVTVSGNIHQGAIFALNNATHVIIDGNSMLTVYNRNNFGYGQRAGIQIYNGSSSNKIQNLKINMEIAGITTGILSVGVFAGGSSLGTSGDNPQNTVENVTFSNVKQAIMVVGESQNNTNWKILNNTIRSTDDAAKAFLGIYVVNADKFMVSGNTVSGIKLPAGVGSNPFHSGVYLENSNNTVVSKNTISNIQNSAGYSVGYGIFIKGDANQINDNSIKNLDSNSSNDGSYGIKSVGNNTSIYRNDIANIFSSEAKNTNGIYVSGNNQLVYNNFVNDVRAAGGGDPVNQSGSGIYINDGISVKLYYNTVLLKTNQATGVSAALFIKAGSKLDVRNNIFVNNQTASTRFAVYSNVTAVGNFDFFDFNDYFSTQYIGSFGSYNNNANIKTNLADWKTATGKDAMSVSINPAFVSTSDLHLQNVPANNTLQGISIAGITKDIDGDDRTKPYMGADEIVCKLPTPVVVSVDPICPAAGKANITNYDSTYTYTFSPSGPTVGTKGEILNFTPDTNYTVKAKKGDCFSIGSDVFSVKISTTVFTSAGWSTEPNLNLSAEIQADYSSSTKHLEVCSLTVTNGVNVTIKSNDYIKIKNNLDVSAGSLTVESDGNLIQVNNTAVNTGNILVKRNMTFRSNERKEYNYLISPVEDANVKTEMYRKADGTAVVAPFALYHNEANNFFYTSSGAYIKGRALAVKEPAYTSGAEPVAFFKGRPFNGTIDYPLAFSGANLGYNLIGNPYPSNLDLKLFYQNNATEIESTFRFWDNSVNDVYVQQGSTYSGNAYAVFNSVAGSRGTGLAASGTSTAVGGKKMPNQFAKTGQGFMVKALGTGKVLKFSNGLRTHESTGSVFFGKETVDDRFYLGLKAPSGIISSAAIVYFEGGNSSFAADDSRVISSSDAVYTFAENEKVAINGRSSFMNTDKINLGSSHFAAGNYTFALGEKEGVFANGQSIYLKDKQTGIITNLSEGAYTFAANAGESTGRFEILYQPEAVLATDGAVKDDLVVYRDGDDFVITSKDKKITQVEVYDSSGRLSLKTEPGSMKTVIPAVSLSNGVYILKINQAGKITNRKIIR